MPLTSVGRTRWLSSTGSDSGRAVHLPRAGEHDLHRRVVVAARLEHRQLAAAVDLEIGVRVAHAVDVAHLPGEVEDDVAVAHEIVHRRLLADVGDVDAHAIGDAVDVEQVAAVVGDERIDEQHVGAERDQPAREIAADEAEAAGDHHRAAAVELAVVRASRARRARIGAVGGVGARDQRPDVRRAGAGGGSRARTTAAGRRRRSWRCGGS